MVVQVGLAESIEVTCVIANTNTRSKNSSSGVTRWSLSGGGSRSAVAMGSATAIARGEHATGAPPPEAPGDGARGGRHDERVDAVLRLTRRDPFDWDALLGFLAARAVPGVEEVAGRVYR